MAYVDVGRIFAAANNAAGLRIALLAGAGELKPQVPRVQTPSYTESNTITIELSPCMVREQTHAWRPGEMSNWSRNSGHGMYSQLPLHDSRREITVLTIHDGRSDGPVECSLRSMSLTNQPTRFNAPFYTWGDLGKTTTINVNGHTVTVTISL